MDAPEKAMTAEDNGITATLSYKGRSVPLDQAAGMIGKVVADLGDSAKAKHQREIREAADRWIRKQGGPYLEPGAAYPAPGEGLFYDPYEPNEQRDFIPAPDLEIIARDLIEDDSALGHLTGYQVVYLWNRKGGQKAGQLTLGKCAKASGAAHFFSDATWIIWLAADHCAELNLTRKQIEAALHHELSHASEEQVEKKGPDGEMETEIRPAIRGHDCEMFRSEVDRYGLWRLPLQAVAPAFQQLSLLDYVAEKERGVKLARDLFGGTVAEGRQA